MSRLRELVEDFDAACTWSAQQENVREARSGYSWYAVTKYDLLEAIAKSEAQYNRGVREFADYLASECDELQREHFRDYADEFLAESSRASSPSQPCGEDV